jgi:hypothetical protein
LFRVLRYFFFSSLSSYAVAAALKTVSGLLDAERHPVLAAEEPHAYDDKYALAEFLTNTSIASQMNTLSVLGLQPDQQKLVSSWVTEKKLPVTLRFLAEDTCTFLKEEDVEVASERDVETTSTTTKTSTGQGIFGGKHSNSSTTEESSTYRVVQRVKEYHWKVGVRYKLFIFPGKNVDDAVHLQQRSTEMVLVTQAGGNTKQRRPLPERTLHPPVDTSLTWFFQMISNTNESSCQFAIERTTSKTPRRNNDIDKAVEAHKQLYDWSRITQGFFLQRIEKEIISKDNPVNLKYQTQRVGGTGIMDPGSIGTMYGLTKEPNFNGRQIRIVEYSKEQQRYKAEPVDPNAGLPPTISIKPANVAFPSGGTQSGPPLATVNDDAVFCPILPLMEHGHVLNMDDVGEFLQEQCRSLDEALEGLSRLYPAKQLIKLISAAEASLVLICKHMEHLTIQYHDGIDYVENMLKHQLIQAIGKEIGQTDFEQFMRFHNPKLFGTQYAPTPFSHAIRRPGHYPDGLLSIEALTSTPSSSSVSSLETVRTNNVSKNGDGGGNSENMNVPIQTWVRSIKGSEGPSFYIPIDAATSVEITGDRFLHGWMQHRFKSKAKTEYHLACRARQFSNFLIIIGNVAGPDQFDPKEAIILSNKDELLIPLLTNVLPSAKEFKDAIQSLSPEQQEFAKAFRAMQLESSVFGVCVVQIKPQLEKLLGLPDGALTKEIQLTEDLMSLFVEYQVPSDLLTFDGPDDQTLAEKVNAVRGYVKSVLDVIDASKKKQLQDEVMKADMRHEMMYGEPPAALEPLGSASSAAEESEVRFDGSIRSPGSRVRRSLMKRVEKGSAAPQREAREMVAAAFAVPSEPMMSMPMVESMPAPASSLQVYPPISPVAKKASRPPPKEIGQQLFPSFQEMQRPVQDVEGSDAPGIGEDFTLIPKVLDAKLETYDTDSALHSTIIKAGSTWTRKRQENFLTRPISSTVQSDEIATEKKKAMDMLDAISRSGTLPIACAELHVFVAVSHCFDNDVLGTVIQDNVNPIEKVERSALLLASTIYGEPVQSLIRNEKDVQRLTASFPQVFALTSE